MVSSQARLVRNTDTRGLSEVFKEANMMSKFSDVNVIDKGKYEDKILIINSEPVAAFTLMGDGHVMLTDAWNKDADTLSTVLSFMRDYGFHVHSEADVKTIMKHGTIMLMNNYYGFTQ